MKIRESGMPKEEQWEKFFDPQSILQQLGLNGNVRDAADFGCGYGTFTIPAAQIISGKIYAIDIEAEMVNAVEQKAEELNLKNIEPVLRDFIAEGSGLKDSSVDFVLLFNILHLDKPAELLRDSYRILKTGGKVGIIHWNYDASTPRPASSVSPPAPATTRTPTPCTPCGATACSPTPRSRPTATCGGRA